MNEHITDIEQELRRLETAIYETATSYRSEQVDAAVKRSTYDAEHSKAMLTIISTADQQNVKMTVAEREALAVKQVAHEMTEARIAEAVADGTKKHLDALQSILSSVQTRAKLIQTERSLTARQV